MKIVLSWLAELIDLHDLTPETLAERLTMTGLPVDTLQTYSKGLDTVVAGRLREVRPHPNADKLSLTLVEIPGETLEIVCGAKNIAPGDLVPVALVGTVLPGGTTIKAAVIRGASSHGMLCSTKELGLGEDHQGILHLPPDTPLGTPVADALGLREVIFDLEVTPNRSDCLSHLGVARHLSAVLDRPLRLPAAEPREQEPAAATRVQVQVEPGSGCRRYSARFITNLTVGPSPEWLRRKLEKAGLRPINNVVDVTNVILLEIGHPLHAFDAGKLAGGLIQARRAKAGETLVTLDGVEHRLSGGELVIADSRMPQALAGVMGGCASEVGEGTREVLLEAAWFDPGTVRRTSRATGCQSESSYRFERGTDPDFGLRFALDRAARLIAETGGGTVLQGVVDVYPEPLPERRIRLRVERAETLLGMPMTLIQTRAILGRLGYGILDDDGQGTLEVRVPSHRPDVSLEEDLVEDLAQVLGYDQIPLRSLIAPLAAPAPNRGRRLAERCRDLGASLGLTEIISYSFYDPVWSERLRLGPDHPWRNLVRLQNPLAEDTSAMRPTLLAGLLGTAMHNQRRGAKRIFLFELGAVFQPGAPGELPAEPHRLGMLLSGLRHPEHWQQGHDVPGADVYDLKGIVEELANRLHVRAPGLRWKPREHPFLHPMIGFSVLSPEGNELGWAGALHPEIQESLKLREAVFAAELDLASLANIWLEKPEIKRFSRFPASTRDLALIVPEECLAAELIQQIRRAGGPDLISVLPFDLYRDDKLPAGTKSLAFSLVFQAQDRTLQDDEIKQLQEKILNAVESRCHAQLR